MVPRSASLLAVSDYRGAVTGKGGKGGKGGNGGKGADSGKGGKGGKGSKGGKGGKIGATIGLRSAYRDCGARCTGRSCPSRRAS